MNAPLLKLSLNLAICDVTKGPSGWWQNSFFFCFFGRKTCKHMVKNFVSCRSTDFYWVIITSLHSFKMGWKICESLISALAFPDSLNGSRDPRMYVGLKGLAILLWRGNSDCSVSPPTPKEWSERDAASTSHSLAGIYAGKNNSHDEPPSAGAVGCCPPSSSATSDGNKSASEPGETHPWEWRTAEGGGGGGGRSLSQRPLWFTGTSAALSGQFIPTDQEMK